ncbi:hypothetical protein GA0115260_103274 [Streptomyces sp. MnatMP-M27]|nr:hypothetical protein GA0115260_103274 [Streptomyces sp. MnatMP-M27]
MGSTTGRWCGLADGVHRDRRPGRAASAVWHSGVGRDQRLRADLGLRPGAAQPGARCAGRGGRRGGAAGVRKRVGPGGGQFDAAPGDPGGVGQRSSGSRSSTTSCTPGASLWSARRPRSRFNVAVPHSVLRLFSDSLWLSVPMLGLLAVCSEADAFIAASLTGFSPTAPRLTFMVVEPMVDLKLIALQSGTFRRAFAPRLRRPPGSGGALQRSGGVVAAGDSLFPALLRNGIRRDVAERLQLPGGLGHRRHPHGGTPSDSAASSPPATTAPGTSAAWSQLLRRRHDGTQLVRNAGARGRGAPRRRLGHRQRHLAPHREGRYGPRVGICPTPHHECRPVSPPWPSPPPSTSRCSSRHVPGAGS